MEAAQQGVDNDVQILIEELRRFGGSVKFGVLCRDDRCSNLLEALGGTLKAAKKRKVVAYDSELLLQGAHDDVEIRLIGDQSAPAAAAAAPATETANQAAAAAPDQAAAAAAADSPAATAKVPPAEGAPAAEQPQEGQPAEEQ